MELLDGGSLADRIAAGPLPWEEVARIGVALSGALESAHRLGVLHRDVKPQNVLFDRLGTPKLLDFGIASVPGAYQTRTSAVSLTLAHAAPEITAGGRATVASDVYALGSTLWTAAAGKAPFVRDGEDTLVPLLARIAASPVPDLPGPGSHRSCPPCSPSRWPRTPPVGRRRRRSSAPGWRTCSARPARPSTAPPSSPPRRAAAPWPASAPVGRRIRADAVPWGRGRRAAVAVAGGRRGRAGGPPAPGPRWAGGLPAALRLQRARDHRPAASRVRRPRRRRRRSRSGTSSAPGTRHRGPRPRLRRTGRARAPATRPPAARRRRTARRPRAVRLLGRTGEHGLGVQPRHRPRCRRHRRNLSASHSSPSSVASSSHPSTSSTATSPRRRAHPRPRPRLPPTPTPTPRPRQARRRDVTRVLVERERRPRRAALAGTDERRPGHDVRRPADPDAGQRRALQPGHRGQRAAHGRARPHRQRPASSRTARAGSGGRCAPAARVACRAGGSSACT